MSGNKPFVQWSMSARMLAQFSPRADLAGSVTVEMPSGAIPSEGSPVYRALHIGAVEAALEQIVAQTSCDPTIALITNLHIDYQHIGLRPDGSAFLELQLTAVGYRRGNS